MMLFPMEGNLLKTHRAYPSSNSDRLLEAISLVLFQIKRYLTEEEYDLTSFQSPDNERLVYALLMAFDPFTNVEIKDVIEKEELIDLADRDQLKVLFQEPLICLQRIKDSVDAWKKRRGTNGYFAFTEELMGSSIPQDEELKYSIYLGGSHARI